ncbi:MULTISPECIES: Crp/Fnr family transcriptional regulator [Pseudomonadaceae]|uniref:Crp/Fnr family transcriptional regulator n=1 Tax=Pseudomonadaceae TaxID=135621 RepID=UPI00187A6F7A|nr:MULTISPECIES: Crp/Fnr family transcriptional regulator [Pseudomonadaceae]MBE7373229.1 Crp/Fnr family transcriptional regulator [Pseudomonas lopnurensis]MCW8160067.1 Crp/Fnr family transcriptional regulator [Stutzerimonas stutzeri]
MHGPDSSHRQALEQAALLQGFRQRSLVEGELLGSPGGPRDSVFIVRNGRIRVYLASEDKEYTLTFLEAGDIYSTHSGAYLQALKASEVLIGETALMSRMLALPGAAPTIIRVLGQTLANSLQLIEDLAFRDVEGRLARFLDGMLARRGRPHEGVQRLELDLSTEDIAHLLGTTRQTASSLISRLARQGILSRVAPGIFDIHRPDLLKQRSQQTGKVSAG